MDATDPSARSRIPRCQKHIIEHHKPDKNTLQNITKQPKTQKHIMKQLKIQFKKLENSLNPKNIIKQPKTHYQTL